MRLTTTLPMLLAAGLLSACAALSTVHSEISTFGEWPAGRAPASYAFDRLPSQQAQPEATARLEALAAPALAKAGFTPVAAGQSPDVRVQVASRSTRTEIELWADPAWWRGGWAPSRRAWPGPWTVADPRWDRTRYNHEVALLIRDAASGQPLYEARAVHEGVSSGGESLGAALFSAALFDFPRSGPNPREVRVPLP